jgi:N-acetylneuraminic acid mutarotase
VNNQVTETLAIDNIGTGAGVFQIFAINAPAPGAAPGAGSGAPLHRIRGHFTPQSIVWARTYGGATKMSATRPLSVAPYAVSSAWASSANMPTAIMDNAGAADSGTGLIYTLDGTNGSSNLNSVYAYDPSSDSWSSMANAPSATEAPTAVDINGKIYMVNGWDVSGNPTAELDIYDTATNTWTTGTPNPVPAAGGSASAVLNGKMYVVGGCDSGSCASPLTAVQVYDPTTDSWSSAANYPQGVTFAMCGGINGKLYCASGSASSEYATGYVYDPSSDSWSPIASIPVASGGLWASGYSAAQGKLLVSGGVTGNFTVVTNAGYAYDPTSDSWSSLPNANDSLYRGAGACGFYRLGGSTGGFAPVTSAEVLSGYSPCGVSSIPWLTVAPTTGMLAVGASANVTLTFDGTGQRSSPPPRPTCRWQALRIRPRLCR